jgi:homogentisate 1,2-dioxygenase
MLDRVAAGELPAKPHIALRGPSGVLRHEECLTRGGFDGPYTILYHENRPHALESAPTGHVYFPPKRLSDVSTEPGDRALRRRHFRTRELPSGGAAIDTRVPLLFNDDVTLSVLKPTASDPAYFVNGDADELFFVRAGQGTVRSIFGDLRFHAGHYVCVPKGTLYRLLVEGDGPLELLLLECKGGVGIPDQWRNEVGQLRMDAPYSHRDFRRTEFRGPLDEGIREVVVKRGDAYHGFEYRHPPLDVLGWDGTVYPWAFPILAFQPRVSSVHLPPTWNGTFAARGLLVCSFVPRPLEFHPEAVPCPFPHASVDVDEVLYYVNGDFSSRSGVDVGSLTLHPAGVPHGPHPGKYEGSIGTRHTEEVAVMLDCHRALAPTVQARNVEDTGYEGSFLG